MDIFQKIINKEIPSEIIYEDKDFIAFKDINPITNGHFLVVPKEVSTNLLDIKDETLSMLMLKARELAKVEITKLNVSGFKLVVNNGVEAGQEIMRTHVHIIPAQK